MNQRITNGWSDAGEPAAKTKATVRCAIYTRKSTEEGLEQEFNSLDAQRESAEAFIASQRHEGWVCLPDRYDDGGFSGGNMDRPALQRLFADIEAGGIDCVVVYKVDRMSRALLDFARIIDLFGKFNVSFVSVTQQFNTTNSMGRLTLNILLSFAQFEREMISERTRDKMSAARRKGKWIGGYPMLGYDVHPKGGRLIVNQREAEQVRAIFRLYLDHKALIPVVRELEHKGWTTKKWTTKKGRERGGRPFSKTSLFRLLTNMVYTGVIEFQGTIYDGEHEAIVDTALWQKVRDLLRRNGTTGGKDVRNKHGALLKGLLYCVPCGTPMGHAYTSRKPKIYRYYVCLNAQKRGWDSCATKSINAHEIETAVIAHIRGIGTNPTVLAETVTKVREDNKRRLAELESEQRATNRELNTLNTRVKKLVSESFGTESNKNLAIDQLADLHDRTRIMEQRMATIREEIASIEKETVDESELSRALALFNALWDSLSLREQARIMRLLIERVGLDGRDGKVTVTFRSAGIRALCTEAGLIGNEGLI
jgi:site-specific DNA recombinase